jgi:hypothetical protein
MKQLIFFLFLFTFYTSFAQQEKFLIEGRVVGVNRMPVTDAYIFNTRDLDKNITNSNGVFSIWVLPSDTLIISHVSYFRKTVTVFSLLTNPTIQLNVDTINIKGVNISPDQKTDYEKAMKNIESIEFDFRPKPLDSYSETERMQELINTENSVYRVEASSVSLLRFSPSEQIGKLVDKMKKRKKKRKEQAVKEKK